MPKYFLHYFDMKGRGEIIRFLFAAGGVQYGENVVQLPDWPAQKPNHALGQLPVLEIDGKPFPESISISRYLAAEFGLQGKTNLENLQIDALVEQCVFLREAFCDAHFEEDKPKQTELHRKFKDETLPRIFGYVEKVISGNSTGSGFVVGDQMTWGDLVLMDVCDIISRDPSILTPYKVIKEHRKKIEALPKIANYLKNRPFRDI
ncbi:glutathione S-transferase [Patella vulgata]|uniref:glutathione S-transferase n=1 Tax=Patella vulgata TaxID=6465 RepID=UPI002180789A|nr:glutathione S-transferase [Patella vulgata]